MGDENNLQAEQSPALDEIQSAYEKGDVTEAKLIFERSFIEYYTDAGYVEVPELPLISDEDGSVLFTGASISAVKGMLMSGEYPTDSAGVCIAQECLRTNALKYAFNNDWIPYGQMYFEMVTILSRPGRFTDVLAEAVDFTQNRLGIDQARIKIRSTYMYANLNTVDTMTHIPVEYDTKPESYYHWVYGINGVHGEGLTICVFNPATGKWFDIGNIVSIYDETGKELGIEFGYGYEFSLTAALGVDQPLKFSKVFECFEFAQGIPQKYYSTLEAVVRMRLAGAKLGDKGVDHVYKQHIKALEFMAESMSKSVEELIADMILFAYFLNRTDYEASMEYEYLLNYIEHKTEFANIVKRIGLNLWDLSKGRVTKEKIRDPKALLENYLVNHGIKPFEVEATLNRLSRFDIF